MLQFLFSNAVLGKVFKTWRRKKKKKRSQSIWDSHVKFQSQIREIDTSKYKFQYEVMSWLKVNLVKAPYDFVLGLSFLCLDDFDDIGKGFS